MLLKSISLITSLSVAAMAILSMPSAGKATTASVSVFKEAAPDPTAAQNYYNCSAPPATDTSSNPFGPIYGTQCNSLPGLIIGSGTFPPENISYNVYNDTPYYETKFVYGNTSTDPSLQFDAANTKSDIFSSITQTSNKDLTLTGGVGIAPYTWFKITRNFSNITGPITSYQTTITFAAVPESSAVFSLLAFGSFGVGCLIKRRILKGSRVM